MRVILPILMIIAAVGAVVMFVMPRYQGIQELKSRQSELSQALANARKLDETKNQMLERYNSFSKDDRKRLKTMLPDNVDNVKLIIELDSLAAQYGLSLQNIKVGGDGENSDDSLQTGSGGNNGNNGGQNYNSIQLKFTVKGPYPQFVQFTKQLERSLRLIDIKSLSFQASEKSDVYQYNMTIETYWLQ